jgi:UDPglucose 6-dehydrogenase
VDAVISANHNRMSSMIHRIIMAAGGSLHRKRVAVLGLTFKANTDDMRESVSLVIIPALVNEGAEVIAHDPAGMEHAKTLLPEGVHFATDAQGCIEGADIAVILTEWDVYRQLPPHAFAAMKQPVLVDMRNLYGAEAMQKAGVTYYSLGRPALQA